MPPLVQLEFEGRYAAMLSHEPKNYALLGYDGTLVLRGVAFRSSRAEPFGSDFLRRAIRALLQGDVEQVRTAEEDLMFSLPKELRQDASGRRDGRALGGRQSGGRAGA